LPSPWQSPNRQRLTTASASRESEEAAYREIDEAVTRVPSDIMSYCAKLGETAGGTYLSMRQCIINEVTAKSQLQ
jgi:hypothetical protein